MRQVVRYRIELVDDDSGAPAEHLQTFNDYDEAKEYISKYSAASGISIANFKLQYLYEYRCDSCNDLVPLVDAQIVGGTLASCMNCFEEFKSWKKDRALSKALMECINEEL